MSVTTEHLEQFFKELPFFKGMKHSDVQKFLAEGNIKKYKKNQPVFLQEDKADRFFIIISGWIKLHRETPEGEEAIVSIITRGDVFGEAAIFCEKQYPFSAHCVEEAQLIVIPANIFEIKVKTNSDIMFRVLKALCHETRAMQLENEHMVIMSTPQRVACLLLRLSVGMVGKGGTFTFPYDKSLAALSLGMKAETFSRALTQLKPLGVSVNGSDVTIDSFVQLKEYTCGHCSAMPGECQRADCSNHCAIQKLCSDNP